MIALSQTGHQLVSRWISMIEEGHGYRMRGGKGDTERHRVRTGQGGARSSEMEVEVDI